MRQTIAKRLSQSKGSIPHAYVSATIGTDKIRQLQKKLAKTAELKLSLNDFIIKACAQALRSVPEVNAQWRADSVQLLPSVDISIAVATPSGLITPILFRADRMGLHQISTTLRALAGRAREGKLRPEEFQGGTFTISNLGMFGSVSNFTAIINPPQAAILAVGGLVETLSNSGEPTSQFGATLCYDARAIDDRSAQRFMQALQTGLTEPAALLAGMEAEAVEDEDQLLMDLETLELQEDSKAREANVVAAAAAASQQPNNFDAGTRMFAKLL